MIDVNAAGVGIETLPDHQHNIPEIHNCATFTNKKNLTNRYAKKGQGTRFIVGYQ